MIYTNIKRLFDIIFSFLALIILSPIFLILILSILISSGRPIFFIQKRFGLNEKVFKIYKFRTMVNNATSLQSKGKTNKEVITFIGRIIRPLHLDEIPQLWNILKGEMGFIGNRPLGLGTNEQLLKYYKKHPKKEHYLKKIFLIRPGLTGLPTVLFYMNDKKRKKILQKLKLKYNFKSSHDLIHELNVYYVENITPLLDIKILYWTVLLELESLNFGKNTNRKF
jgi:undecaprenyl phosphate N,N'-diacetylbacillosamine 1-phosphate transferase